ncbi:MAG: choice-of-anchor J domain-containing protein, partial [Dysgonamonadaceae bacterium]|nr:choice-of-anchor J domain-containing protein [Dysgonamonadaceae bacterium]
MKKLCFSLLAILFAVQGWSQTTINESFEGEAFPPTGWTNYTKAFTRSSSLAHTGTHSIGYTDASSSHPTYGIITPQFTGGANQLLSFYIYTGGFYSTDLWYTSFRIKVSTTDNSVSSFNTVKEYSTYDYSGIYSDKVILAEADIEGTWYECTADLSAYNGQQIYVAIEVYDNNGCAPNVQIDDILIKIPKNDDISIASITSPTSGTNLSATAPVSFIFRNLGINPVAACDFQLVVDDALIATESWEGTLTYRDTTTYTFTTTADLSAEGPHTISVIGVLANDEDNSNDTLTITVTNVICDLKTLPFEEHFDEATLYPCWTLVDEDGNNHNWQIVSDANHSGTGYGIHSYTYIADGWWGLNIIAKNWLISPQLSIPENGALLSFWAKNIDPNYSDRLKVMVSTTGAEIADFTQIWTDIPDVNNFENFILDLTAYGNENIYIAFYHDDEGMNGLFLDDITVYAIEDCMMPMQFATSDITSNSATVSWHPAITTDPYG